MTKNGKNFYSRWQSLTGVLGIPLILFAGGALCFLYGVYKYHLPLKAFIVHLVILISVLVVASCLDLLTSYFLRRKTLLRFWCWGYWSIVSLALVLLYALHYLSLAAWGLPIHYRLLYDQIAQFPYLVEALPVNNALVYILTSLPFLLIPSLISLFVTKMVTTRSTITEKEQGFFQKTLTSLKLLSPLVIILLTLQFDYVSRRVFLNKRIPTDPLLAFFHPVNARIPTDNQDDWREHDAARKSYPENAISERPNIILVICDALRADHLGGYGYSRLTSPFIDSLIQLDQAYAHPRYFSISSQSYTGISASLGAGHDLTTAPFFLQEILKKQGYNTRFTFSGNFTNFYFLKNYLSPGVDNYSDGATYIKDKIYGESSTRDDATLVNKFLDDLPEWDGLPLFQYLHFMSVHQVGELSDEYRRYLPDEWIIGNDNATPLINNYDNRILQFDDRLKEAINSLAKKNYLEDAIIIITSDHGQALLENGHFWHAQSTNMGETYIPLIIVRTGGNSLPKRKASTINGQEDLPATVLDLLQLPVPATWNGTSIFQDTINGPVFQKERDYLSVIFPSGDSLYQYTYKVDDNLNILSDITDPVNPKKIDQVPKKVIDRWRPKLLNRYGTAQR